tara:strand:- start:532 stop:1707 length:1176 start_codon:yes stop_codon:yes gene_type:complete
LWYLIFLIPVLFVAFLAVYGYALRRKNMHYWLGSYYFPTDREAPQDNSDEPIDLFIAICDHYEPQRGNLPKPQAMELVNRWCEQYPKLFDRFEDINGRKPQHTFFFPQDEYQPEYLDALKFLCDAGYGDVDIHLHHRDDTPEGLTEKLITFRDELFHRHGLLRRHPITEEIVYGFIHGNWSLCNSHPGGYDCGVDQELSILKETGCYADFTLPSAPSPTQVCTINSIYYAWDRPGITKSHDTGQRSKVGRKPPEDALLMIQGPLVPDWKNRKLGIFPSIENSDLHGNRPPTMDRFDLWQKANVHVLGKPNWKFIKLHTHGCKEGNIDMLLGPEMVKFHEQLAERHAKNPQFRYHYVTAWDMYQLVKQAEGNVETKLKIAEQHDQLFTSQSP